LGWPYAVLVLGYGRSPKGSRDYVVLDQARNLIRQHLYSIHTEEAYIKWIKQYILFPYG
jgi:hypothetical protein